MVKFHLFHPYRDEKHVSENINKLKKKLSEISQNILPTHFFQLILENGS